MILTDLKNYIKTRQQVSLKDIALHFDVEPETAKGMLDFLVKKGRISLRSNPLSCASGCSSCSEAENSDIYIWNAQLGNISIQAN